VPRAPQPTLRHPDRSRQPWIRAFLFEARRSDLMVSIFKKSQDRNKKAGDRKGIIELLLIILGGSFVIAEKENPEEKPAENPPLQRVIVRN
jgi:hypothetical protein